MKCSKCQLCTLYSNNHLNYASCSHSHLLINWNPNKEIECNHYKERGGIVIMRCRDCYHFISHMKKYWPQDWESRVDTLIYFPCVRLVRFKSPNSKTCELFTDKNINQPELHFTHRRLEVYG